MTTRRTLLAAALAATASSRISAADTVRGSGALKTERRAVAGYSRVGIGGDFLVDLRQGDVEGVEITADDNVLPFIETVVEGSPGSARLTIQVRRDARIAPSRPVAVRIDVKTLSSLSLGGAGRVVVASLRAPELSLSIGGTGEMNIASLDGGQVRASIGGSGRVALAGHAQHLDVSIGGSGTCAAAPLSVDDASVRIGGSGDAEVTAQKALRIAIAGSGTVRYGGAAAPVATIAGSGKVVRL